MIYNYTVFETKHSKYLFDGVSCNIFEITDNIFNNHTTLFDKIVNGLSYKDDLYSKDCKDIFEAINNGLLLSAPEQKPQYWFNIEEYKNSLKNRINHLMIEITEECNMRCKYCVYSGHYKNERPHGIKEIDKIIIQKSLDFFFENSKMAPKKVINFYGGEPFLKFTKIKEIVKYVNNIDSSIEIYITTNGTLLNKETYKWFAENKNVNIYISFAGVKKLHDQLRVFKNGKPTFDIVKTNLMAMKNFDSDAYNNRISFIFNIFDEFELLEIDNLWKTEEIFKNCVNLPEVTYIDSVTDDGYIKKLSKKAVLNYNHIIKPLDIYIQHLKSKMYNNVIVKYFDKKYLPIHCRIINENYALLGAVCRPFINKIFIDVYGNLSICENFKFGNKFGNILHEVNFNVVDELLGIYQEKRSEKCKYCWVSKICTLCYKDLILNTGIVDIKRAENLCDEQKKATKQILSEYCSILEEGENLLDHLDRYVIEQ